MKPMVRTTDEMIKRLNGVRCVHCAAPLPPIGPICESCQRPRYVPPVKQKPEAGAR